ncbi:MAG: hypothetical protein M3024_09100 [Candidatus Dormibacteraeota bacterium]|nr:hypothetical protein [Candidatus Dormibacteraeota bacterium]
MTFLDLIRDRAKYYNCPVCGRTLRDCEMRLLRHVDDRYTVQVTCASCRVQFIVVLQVSGGAVEAVSGELEGEPEPLLERDEPEARPPREPVTADEVLDVHLALRDFEGAFSELLRQPSADRQ